MKRSCVVSCKCSNVVGTEDWHEQLKFTLVKKFIYIAVTKVESMIAQVGDAVTERGMGFGKVLSKPTCESRKFKEPKYDDLLERTEVKTAVMIGERGEIFAATAAERRTRFFNCLAGNRDKESWG